MYRRRYQSQPAFTTLTANANEQLSDVQLQTFAPSIFAATPWEKTSSRYAFVPTSVIVDKLRSEGFQPFNAQQSKTRVPGKQDFTKHLIRFRDLRAKSMADLGLGFTPEVILINSHDGTSRYKLFAGSFTQACLNGMVCGDSFQSVNVMHTGNIVDDVIEATYSVVEEFPRMIEAVKEFQGITLSRPQQLAYAEAALELKYDEEHPAPISASQLISPDRQEDAHGTLWNTLNQVQEKLIRGGVKGYAASTFRRVTTRGVKGITENTALNRSLWTLAERMQELVGVAA